MKRSRRRAIKRVHEGMCLGPLDLYCHGSPSQVSQLGQGKQSHVQIWAGAPLTYRPTAPTIFWILQASSYPVAQPTPHVALGLRQDQPHIFFRDQGLLERNYCLVRADPCLPSSFCLSLPIFCLAILPTPCATLKAEGGRNRSGTAQERLGWCQSQWVCFF